MKPEYWERAKRALRKDPVMAAIMRQHPGVYMTVRGEPFMTLARAICGQQISVKAAQSVWNRVCVCLDQKITPEAVVAANHGDLGKHVGAVADQVHIADGRRYAAVLYQVGLGHGEDEVAV